MEVEFKGKKIDLSKALPLKLRDWKELERRGVTAKQFDQGVMQAISSVAYYVLSKVDTTITQDDVDDLELKDPVLQQVMTAIGGEAPDRPSLTSSM